jgi:hypothetical protein
LDRLHRKRHKIIQADGDDVEMTVVHLKMIIRQLRQGAFVHYPEDMYRKKATATCGGGSAYFEGKKLCDAQPRAYMRCVKLATRQQWTKMIPSFTSQWVTAHDIWPEAKRHHAQPPVSHMFHDVDSMGTSSRSGAETDDEVPALPNDASEDSSDDTVDLTITTSNKRPSTSALNRQSRGRKKKQKSNSSSSSSSRSVTPPPPDVSEDDLKMVALMSPPVKFSAGKGLKGRNARSFENLARGKVILCDASDALAGKCANIMWLWDENDLWQQGDIVREETTQADLDAGRTHVVRFGHGSFSLCLDPANYGWGTDYGHSWVAFIQ